MAFVFRGPGLIPRVGHLWADLFSFSCLLREVFLRVLRFPSLLKESFLNSNSISNTRTRLNEFSKANKLQLHFVSMIRKDVQRLRETKAQKRMEEDHSRTLNDWNRMNLTELKALPEQSRFHVKKAILSYLGTSKGSKKALQPFLNELNGKESQA